MSLHRNKSEKENFFFFTKGKQDPIWSLDLILSATSLIYDKGIVDQENEWSPTWDLCLYVTRMVRTSVSYFVGICSWNKVPSLKIT